MNKEEDFIEEELIEVTFGQLAELFNLGVDRVEINPFPVIPQINALKNCTFEITEQNLLDFTKACLIGNEDDYE